MLVSGASLAMGECETRLAVTERTAPLSDVEEGHPPWQELPDDVMNIVFERVQPNRRVLRLVCKQWEQTTGRLIRRLRPERLDVPRIRAKFPYLTQLDLSNCLCVLVSSVPVRLASESLEMGFGWRKALEHDSKAPAPKVHKCAMADAAADDETYCGSVSTVVERDNKAERDGEECGLNGRPEGEAETSSEAQDALVQGSKQGSEAERLREAPLQERMALLCKSLITDEALRPLPSLSSLNQLSLQHCMHVTDKGLATICRLPQITHLNLQGCTGLTGKGLASLSNLVKLTSVVLRDNQSVSDESMVALSHLPRLAEMDLGYVGSISADGFGAIGRCAALSSLDLHQCSSLSDEGIRQLATGVGAAGGLQRLTVSATGLTDDGIGSVARLQHLTYLNAMCCDQFTVQAVRSLASLRKLHTLKISGGRRLTHLQALRALPALPALEVLDAATLARLPDSASAIACCMTPTW